jgi:hypothetical protein
VIGGVSQSRDPNELKYNLPWAKKAGQGKPGQALAEELGTL